MELRKHCSFDTDSQFSFSETILTEKIPESPVSGMRQLL